MNWQTMLTRVSCLCKWNFTVVAKEMFLTNSINSFADMNQFIWDVTFSQLLATSCVFDHFLSLPASLRLVNCTKTKGDWCTHTGSLSIIRESSSFQGTHQTNLIVWGTELVEYSTNTSIGIATTIDDSSDRLNLACVDAVSSPARTKRLLRRLD